MLYFSYVYKYFYSMRVSLRSLGTVALGQPNGNYPTAGQLLSRKLCHCPLSDLFATLASWGPKFFDARAVWHCQSDLICQLVAAPIAIS